MDEFVKRIIEGNGDTLDIKLYLPKRAGFWLKTLQSFEHIYTCIAWQ